MFGEESRFFITYHEKLCILYKAVRGGNSRVILTPTKQLHPVLFLKVCYNIKLIRANYVPFFKIIQGVDNYCLNFSKDKIINTPI